MTERPQVAILIPALNEAAALRIVLPAVRENLAQCGGLAEFQLLVVDNGSTDETSGVVAAEGAVVVHEPRRGYGSACAAGLAYLAQTDAVPQIVVFLDGDGSDEAADLPLLLRPILDDGADLVIGCRDRGLREAGSLTPPQAFGTWLAVSLMRLIWGYRYRDLGPFRAVRWSALQAMEMRDRAFGWTVEMQVRAVQLRLRIGQVGVRYRRRQRGRSKISGTIRGVFLAGYSILSTIGRLALSQGPSSARGV